MANKVLLVAPYFPPRRRVGSIRPFRFATYLKETGWSPAVICIQEHKEELTEKEKEALKGIPIHQVEVPLSIEKNGSASKKSSSLSLASFIDNRFPLDTWLPLFIKEKRGIMEFSKAFEPELVWSTSDPWSSNYLGMKISKSLNLPWVADFRDPWTLCGTRYQVRKWPATFFDKRFERKVMNKASKVTFTAKSTESKYLDYYPILQDKAKTIYNSFDKDFYKEDSNVQITSLSKKKLNILFLGKFRSLSTASDILQIFDKLKDKSSDYTDAVEVYSFGDLMGEDLEQAKELGVDNQFKTISIVPNENVLGLINKFDLLLLSTHSSRDDIVPAKLIDYLISKPPIFSLAPNKEVGEIVKKTQRGAHFNQNEKNEAASFLQECISLKLSAKELPYFDEGNQSEIDRFNAKQTTEQLAAIFKELI